MRIAAIRHSGLFDEDWYLARNSDVRNSGVDPLLHYVLFGAGEDRWPNPIFDPLWYRRQHGLSRQTNPLLDFVRQSRRTYREPNALFKSQQYLALNADVDRANLAPFRHYLMFGASEMRPPSFAFAPGEYALIHPQISPVGFQAMQHALDGVARSAPVGVPTGAGRFDLNRLRGWKAAVFVEDALVKHARVAFFILGYMFLQPRSHRSACGPTAGHCNLRWIWKAAVLISDYPGSRPVVRLNCIGPSFCYDRSPSFLKLALRSPVDAATFYTANCLKTLSRIDDAESLYATLIEGGGPFEDWARVALADLLQADGRGDPGGLDRSGRVFDVLKPVDAAGAPGSMAVRIRAVAEFHRGDLCRSAALNQAYRGRNPRSRDAVSLDNELHRRTNESRGFVQRPIADIADGEGRFLALGQSRPHILSPVAYFGCCSLSIRASHEIAGSWAAEIDNGRIHDSTMAVTSDETLWQLSPETRLPLESGGYSTEFVANGSDRYSRRSTRDALMQIDQGILISDRVSSNHFHFVFDAVPKLLTAQGLPDYAGWPIIADARMDAVQKEWLRRLTDRSRKIYWMTPGFDLTVGRLLVVAGAGYLPDDPTLDLSRAFVDPDAIRIVAQEARRLVKAGPRMTVYASRRSYASALADTGYRIRDIHNGQEIEDLFRDAVICSPETLSLAEQADTFGNADLIAMAAGAAVTNLLFCAPGTKVLVMSQDRNVNPGLIAVVAQALGLDVAWVFGCGLPDRSVNSAHWRFVVDPLDVTRAVEHLEKRHSEPSGMIPFH